MLVSSIGYLNKKGAVVIPVVSAEPNSANKPTSFQNMPDNITVTPIKEEKKEKNSSEKKLNVIA